MLAVAVSCSRRRRLQAPARLERGGRRRWPAPYATARRSWSGPARRRAGRAAEGAGRSRGALLPGARLGEEGGAAPLPTPAPAVARAPRLAATAAAGVQARGDPGRRSSSRRRSPPGRTTPRPTWPWPSSSPPTPRHRARRCAEDGGRASKKPPAPPPAPLPGRTSSVGPRRPRLPGRDAGRPGGAGAPWRSSSASAARVGRLDAAEAGFQELVRRKKSERQRSRSSATATSWPRTRRTRWPRSSSTARPSSGCPTTTPRAAKMADIYLDDGRGGLRPAAVRRGRRRSCKDAREVRHRPQLAPGRRRSRSYQARLREHPALADRRPLERAVALAVLVDVDRGPLSRVARASRSTVRSSPPTFSRSAVSPRWGRRRGGGRRCARGRAVARREVHGHAGAPCPARRSGRARCVRKNSSPGRIQLPKKTTLSSQRRRAVHASVGLPVLDGDRDDAGRGRPGAGPRARREPEGVAGDGAEGGRRPGGQARQRGATGPSAEPEHAGHHSHLPDRMIPCADARAGAPSDPRHRRRRRGPEDLRGAARGARAPDARRGLRGRGAAPLRASAVRRPCCST